MPSAAAACADEPRVCVLPIAQLSDELRGDWDAIRAGSAHYRSPFFSHQFAEAMGRLQPGVEVAVVLRGGRAVAFFPFQRGRAGAAQPVGLGINDAHGMLAAPGMDIAITEVLRASGLKRFAFHASPLQAPGVVEFESGRKKAFLADLTVDPQGYEHYLCSRNTTIARQGQKTRRLIRQLGALRFEFDCRDTELLRQMIELKSAQYQRTHTFNIFSVGWIQQLIFQLHDADPWDSERSSLRGVLNVLFAGEVPVAFHYGILEGDLLHYWFPVYDPQYAPASPGTELFLQVARYGAAHGLTAIDMGYGEQAYKYKLTNVITEMSYGWVDSNPLRRAFYQGNASLRSKLKTLGLRNKLKPLARRLMPGYGKENYGG